MIVLRRCAALAIDLAIAQVVAQALLNFIWWPLPVWVCPFALPAVYVTYATALTMRGARARTLGKRALGLEIRSSDGSRPTTPQLRIRSAAFSAMWLVDWNSVFTGASGKAATFGAMLVISIVAMVVLLSWSIVTQLRSGAATPHDAVAGTEVVRATADSAPRERRSFSPLTAALAALLASGLFVYGMATAFREDDCPPCRETESIVSQRFGALTRVSMTTHAKPGNPGVVSWLETNVWMPFVVAPRPQRDTMLRVAAAVAEQRARMLGWTVERRTVTQELSQAPLSLSVIHELPDFDRGGQIVLRVGTGGGFNLLHLDLGFQLTFDAVPVEHGSAAPSPP